MFRILAVRLTILYTLLFSLLALAVFVLIYHSLAADLKSRVDTALRNDGEELTAIYQSEGMDALVTEMHLEAEEEGLDNAFYRAYSPDHQLIETSDLTAWDGLSSRSRLLDSPVEVRYETVNIPGHSHLARLFYQNLGDGHILQIGFFLTHEEQLLTNFTKVSIGAFILFLVVGGGGGLLVARRALAGIERVRRSADRISRGDLSQPIPPIDGSVEIGNLVKSFNWMQERIQTLISELQGVTNNVAHDLRSPVTRMRGMAETTLTGPQALDEYRDLAGAVIEESDRLVGMINTMLEIAETDAGVRPLPNDEIDIVGIINDVTDLYASVAEDQGLRFEVRVSDLSPVVTGNLSQLQRAFANLLDNAFKFTPEGGRVSLDLTVVNDRVLLTIQDTGPGISAESLPHIFDRFYRGDQSRTSGGSGLGLSLVRAIVNAHHGEVHADSLAGHGARFSLFLPLKSTVL